MIVNVTRGDLRDEFFMADEAFALSPISARATQPSEEDYDAIREAFMETSRGRWFLGEYAKRNRNADTRMVLDAVARIEESLAASKQPPPDHRLADALIAIRQAVSEARTAATAALEGQAPEENLAPLRRGARIIKEISWRWREIGGDGRICDLLDSQVSAIEGACGQIAATDPLTAVDAAFDALAARIAAFDGGDGAPQPQVEESAPSPAPSDGMPAVPPEQVEPATATSDADIMTAPAIPAEAIATDETPEAMADVADEIAETAADDAYEAQDEAVLDLIALEMAAPDPDDADEYPPEAGDAEISDVEISDAEISAFDTAASPPAEAEIVTPQPNPIEAPAAMHATLPPSLQPSLHQPPLHQPSFQQPSPEQPSLGSSLLANGIVRRPKASVSDPLAPIRRLSQAEKIALFS
jgi:hypothetical protein